MSGNSRLGHAIFAALLAAVLCGWSAWSALHPSHFVDAQERLDITLHPYGVALGAMMPGLLGGLAMFVFLRWRARKRAA